jgi:hypothetical protein
MGKEQRIERKNIKKHKDNRRGVHIRKVESNLVKTQNKINIITKNKT